MFDHLGPIPKISFRKKSVNYRAYLSFLLLAIVVYLVAWSAQSGSNIVAAPAENPQLSVSAKVADQTVVLGSPNLSILSLQIETSAAGVALKSLNIQSQGIYQPEFLLDLKLSHNGMQLGQLSSVDSQGILHFDLNGYVLPMGKNEILLTVKDSAKLAVGDILNFNLADASSLVWSYKSKEYVAKGDWPVSSGTINVVDKGSLWAYQGLNKTELAVLANQDSELLEFILAIDGERIDLDKLIFQYKTTSDDTINEFSLLVNDAKVASAKNQVDLIEFTLDKTLPLAINQPLNLSLVGKLTAGEYEFELVAVKGRGLVSGQEIVLGETLAFNKVKANLQLIQFVTLPIDKNISQDWLAIANLSVKKLAPEPAALNRLTWHLNSSLVDIKAAKILVNDKIKNLDLVIKDDQIIAKTSWSDPIVLSEFSTNIKLLVQVDKFQEGAFIQTSLLGDDKQYQVDQWSDNLLWSVAGEIYNAYGLPSLPLEPQLISS